MAKINGGVILTTLLTGMILQVGSMYGICFYLCFFKGHYTQRIYSRGLAAQAPEKLSGPQKGGQTSASSHIIFQGRRALTKFQGLPIFTSG